MSTLSALRSSSHLVSTKKSDENRRIIGGFRESLGIRVINFRHSGRPTGVASSLMVYEQYNHKGDLREW